MEAGSGIAVSARGLVKTYGALTAVAGVDFEIREGECFGFLGPNGAGKTTTMKMIYCCLPRTGGDLAVMGLDPDRSPAGIKARIGVVPQETNLDTDFTVLENLRIHARYFGVRRREAAARAAELLAFVRLSEKAGAEVDALSSGMKRRLLIARGLMNEPRLLILDEPTVGLDPQARHLVWDRLRRLERGGVTRIVTTHYMEEAAEICDRVAVMDGGRILVTGRPRDLIRQQIGEEVIEMVPSEEERSAIAADIAAFPARVEQAGEKLSISCDDCRPLMALLSEKGYRRITRRPATLEDVFLKLTGRDLVE
ncbi:MAG: ATP-binding cassette domain-containing protein [bacterium]|nr:ATP-binding cassette domain-containing protein [bacterium]